MQKPADNAELKARLYESLVGVQAHDASKQSIREAHSQQRERRDLAEQEWLRPRRKRVIEHFAESTRLDKIENFRPQTGARAVVLQRCDGGWATQA